MKRLAHSSKAWVVLAFTAGAVLMNVLGHVEGETTLKAILGVVVTFLGGNAIEDAAGKMKS